MTVAGKTWDRSKVGPRLTIMPENGCMNGCGEDRASMLMDFALVLRGKQAGHWVLCRECYEWGNPRDPRDGDPLQVIA